jgi:SAM-dependent methyltransferase
VTGSEQFTVLTCHQGLQFMPDKPAAIGEMRRVLAPGGRVAVATWCALEDTPGMRDLNAVAERHVGRIVDARHSFGDASALSSLLVDAGFSHVDVNTLAHDVQFADGALFARLNAMAVIGMSEKGKAMSEAERGDLADRIAEESRDAIAKLMKNGTFVLPLTSTIATADV